MKHKILVIAAHPDDEVIGCGGTIAKYVNMGCEAYTLILGEGITSRDFKRNKNKREFDIKKLKKQLGDANKIIGIKKVYAKDFPDNRFDTVPLLDIVKSIEDVIFKIKPDIIYTHNAHDLNVDHQVVFNAVMTATRPVKNETVKEIYSFEVLSSTEWNFNRAFKPDTFVDIYKTLDLKIKAMRKYTSELKSFPHPRSLKSIKLNSSYWGMRVGLLSAEVFKTIRNVK